MYLAAQQALGLHWDSPQLYYLLLYIQATTYLLFNLGKSKSL